MTIKINLVLFHTKSTKQIQIHIFLDIWHIGQNPLASENSLIPVLIGLLLSTISKTQYEQRLHNRT